MKIYRIQNNKLELTEENIPNIKNNEVLVKIKALSLNYRDLLVTEGIAHWKPKENRVPFSDAAGEIVEIGESTSRFKVGDRVTSLILPNWEQGKLSPEKINVAIGGASSDGVLAEYVAFPENYFCKIPDYLSYEEAATLPVAALTAWNAVIEQSNLKLGNTILIIGTGGVSLFALQFAKLAGYNIIITSSSDDKLKKARALGAHHTINYKTHKDWIQEVLDLTAGQGVDQVVDVVGGSHISESLKCIKSEGIISMVGVIDGTTVGSINTGTIMYKSAKIQGIETGSTEMYQRMLIAMDLHKVNPVIEKIFAFDKVDEALNYLKKGSHFGKICIELPE
ncbi:NADPH:quinone reductase-like Zn-dependent oxidoreductase [Ulvibacter sp. MAR_2010_11]|uniref:zinc-dependent alcohol dehydrogenase family protein n=1 Tax=Ulvibacter sp. MAR_2010_11 TaxID=1250229 RepID=UPI000C2C648B|nr:NAD(P)-dependent alcohol dehydrogenase [Ulvibacter sp. MAR_2010_11]PKA84013.1 NADPH:quinone reductase-like Zn-dependent oxidoreductase [Ulvibacter sp. MAR_2010_11]